MTGDLQFGGVFTHCYNEPIDLLNHAQVVLLSMQCTRAVEQASCKLKTKKKKKVTAC